MNVFPVSILRCCLFSSIRSDLFRLIRYQGGPCTSLFTQCNVGQNEFVIGCAPYMIAMAIVVWLNVKDWDHFVAWHIPKWSYTLLFIFTKCKWYVCVYLLLVSGVTRVHFIWTRLYSLSGSSWQLNYAFRLFSLGHLPPVLLFTFSFLLLSLLMFTCLLSIIFYFLQKWSCGWYEMIQCGSLQLVLTYIGYVDAIDIMHGIIDIFMRLSIVIWELDSGPDHCCFSGSQGHCMDHKKAL